ncbi:hypothetical protein PNK_1464 [Candidatus Protochlamydia naegleriophila]|uniref:Uncharacterized protein n=1 Tax=Candidatus Protochlamydia naegleriophila TaxID=389348 RepID=A0A0U5JE60_9BACT|nr:hypothetical protein PNK_1464 [Candidatus Protochlamydia naegleriophila]
MEAYLLASDDVAEALLKAVLETPKNETLDIAGPKCFRFSEIVEIYLKATNDPHTIVSDSNAPYFGAKLNDNTLVPQKMPMWVLSILKIGLIINASRNNKNVKESKNYRFHSIT